MAARPCCEPRERHRGGVRQTTNTHSNRPRGQQNTLGLAVKQVHFYYFTESKVASRRRTLPTMYLRWFSLWNG